MNRLYPVCLKSLALGGFATPALAHFTSPAAPHGHPGDVWGLLAVAALVALAAWLDRRSR
jgi:hypothetical protein